MPMMTRQRQLYLSGWACLILVISLVYVSAFDVSDPKTAAALPASVVVLTGNLFILDIVKQQRITRKDSLSSLSYNHPLSFILFPLVFFL